MKLNEEQIKSFESKYVTFVTKLFKPQSKLHYKWYGVTNDTLNQFGTATHLFASEPAQIIFETYDHGKPSQVEILFFDNKLKETDGIKLKNKWKIGQRISDRISDKKYVLINPKGEKQIVELGSNLYTKVFKSLITKTNTTEF